MDKDNLEFYIDLLFILFIVENLGLQMMLMYAVANNLSILYINGYIILLQVLFLVFGFVISKEAYKELNK